MTERADASTAELIVNVNDTIEKLMGKPRKPGPHRAEMIRCCGTLDKEEARGWLLNDALGRPLLHRNDDLGQNHARDVGKRLQVAATEAKADIAREKQAAQNSIRSARRAAEADASRLPCVVQAEKAGAVAVADALSRVIDLGLPNVTIGAKRPATYFVDQRADATATQAKKARARLAIAEAEWESSSARFDRAFTAYETNQDAPGVDARCDYAVAHFNSARADFKAATELEEAAAATARAAALAAASRAWETSTVAQQLAEIKAAASEAAEELSRDEWSLRHRREKLARTQAQIGRVEAKLTQEQAEWDWDRAEDMRWQTAKCVLRQHTDYRETDGGWASVAVVDVMDEIIRCVSGLEWPYGCGEVHEYGQYPESDADSSDHESDDADDQSRMSDLD